MRIPVDKVSGYPTLRTSHIRSYGAEGLVLADMETLRGCPRQYRKRYEEGGEEKEAYALSYGTMLHRVLYAMEEHAIGPEEALRRFFDPQVGFKGWQEVREDLEAYLERGGPMAKFGTIDVEIDLTSPLYVDEDFGPIEFGGRIDWLGIDVNEPQVLHVVDYKSNRSPPSEEDVRGDVQLKAYTWLVRRNWATWMPHGRPQVITHLDAVKWKDIAVRYDDAELEEWEEWAIAVARSILRDDVGRPVLNPGCSWCHVKMSCPAFRALPDQGPTLLINALGETPEALWEWRQKAQVLKAALEKGIGDVDAALEERAVHDGGLRIGSTEWYVSDEFGDVLDTRQLHDVLGDRFYDLASVPKVAIERARLQPDVKAKEKACWSRDLRGRKMKRRKARDGG